MITKDKLFQTGNKARIWQKYCGFLDLSLSDFMEIQEQLLMNQIELIHSSPLAKKFMPQKPRDVAEFRRLVPLTTYEDYAPYLSVKNEEVLAVKPYCWVITSGRGGILKWIPWTEETVENYASCGIAAAILACTSRKGEVNIRSGMRALQNLPPPPYASGILSRVMAEMLDICFIPPINDEGDQDFTERIQLGFKMALKSGVDLLSSLTSVLIKMGQSFTESSGQIKFSWRMLHPQIMRRLVTAWVRCKVEGRALLPKDLWPLRGLLAYGMETDIYREQLEYYWGKQPLEIYSATESGTVATQAWNKKAMTFIPYSSFREFVPEEEWLKSREDKSYQPATVLTDELEPGKLYEVIITNFYGMPFLRYRLGDLIKVVALEDEETGVKIPQMVFANRADDLIDIAGFTRLDEKTVWQAIANSGIKHEDWSARKEYHQNEPVIHLYIELKEQLEATEVQRLVHREIAAINKDYSNLESMLSLQPLRVTLLPESSFKRYYEKMKASGANLAHLKPPHMNASDTVIKNLMKQSTA